MQSLIDKLDLDIFLRAEILLNFLLRLIPHIILNAEVEAKLLVFLMHIVREAIDLDFLQFLESLNFFEQRLDADVLVVLILEQFRLEGVELVLGEEADVIHFVLVEHAEIEVAFLEFLQVLFQSLPVLLMPEPVLEIYLVEVADHVLGLVLRVIDLLDSVEDNRHDDFMRHDASALQEVLVALLDALYGGFEHVFGLAVDADADR